MVKIALIGAGSVVFTRNLINDVLSYPALNDCTISLMDIDAERLALARDLVQAMIDARNVPARVEATMDRAASVRDARYVIVTIQVGGLEAYAHDIEIPTRYGVGQCVGDTLGPGGIFGRWRTCAHPTASCSITRIQWRSIAGQSPRLGHHTSVSATACKARHACSRSGSARPTMK